eukprot:5507676-Amphidinium_carterae.2
MERHSNFFAIKQSVKRGKHSGLDTLCCAVAIRFGMAAAWEVFQSDDEEAADSQGSSLASSLDRTTLSLSTGHKRMKTEEGCVRVASPEEPGEVDPPSCVQGHQGPVLEAWPAMVLHGFEAILKTMGEQKAEIILETGCSGTNSVAIALEAPHSFPNLFGIFLLHNIGKLFLGETENRFILTEFSLELWPWVAAKWAKPGSSLHCQFESTLTPQRGLHIRTGRWWVVVFCLLFPRRKLVVLEAEHESPWGQSVSPERARPNIPEPQSLRKTGEDRTQWRVPLQPFLDCLAFGPM